MRQRILPWVAVCKEGYFLRGNTCTACQLGATKAVPGNGQCTECTLGRTTASTGSTSPGDCGTCAGRVV